MDWQVPLVISAAVFGAFLLWKLRPQLGGPSNAAARAALKEAQKRLEAATTDEDRALALCDAGDACVQGGLGAAGSAAAYYLRAMRANPRGVDVVERACRGLARRPRALESLLWRRLAAETWSGPGEASARRALQELAALYEGPMRNPTKARAMEQALAAVRGRLPGT